MKAPPPPANIQWLVDAVGVDVALLVIEEYGGTAVWIQSGVGNDHSALRHKFEAAFGKTATQALIRYFGGGRIVVPLCKAWRIELYAARGMSASQIALKLGCSDRTVWRRLTGDRGNAELLRQMTLPL